MSLINQMLQDLEKRQGEPGGAGQLPLGVHSAPAVAAGKRRGWLVATAVLFVAAAGGAIFATDLRSLLQTPESSVDTPVAATVPPAVPAAEISPVALLTPAVPLPELVAALPDPALKLTEVLLPAPATAPQPPIPAVQAEVATVPRAVTAPATPSGPKSAPPAPSDSTTRPVVRQTASAGSQAPLKTSSAGDAPERAEASYREALAAFGQGRAGDSQGLARKALDEMPGHIGARQLLIRQFIEQRMNDQARAELRLGLQQLPSQVLWATWLVRLELERGDLAAARQAVDQALPYAANQADFQSLAGAVAQRQGKPDEAAEFYRTALNLKPADGRAWIGLGLALEGEGHGPEAKEAFRRALTVEGLSPELTALAQRKTR